MKNKFFKIIFTLLVILGAKSYAQQVDEYKQTTDSLLQHLDKSGVSTGVLYDRVFPVSALNNFNMVVSDTSSTWHFIQAYSEFYRAAYTPPSSWKTVKQLKDQIGYAKLQNRIPVGLANYTFNVIDTNSIDLGLIQQTVDSTYYDVPGRSRHPFNIVNSFVASVLTDSVKIGNVDFDFSALFTFNYGNRTITSLSVDFDNGGGSQSVSLGALKSVYYSDTGLKTIKFTANFSDNTSIITYSSIKIFGELDGNLQLMGAKNCNLTTTFTLWSKLSFQGYDETTATKGFGDVTVFHSTTNNCDGIIRKPVIIMDGFDPGDAQSGTQLYAEYLNNAQKGKLGDSLRNKGHDVFILNFPLYNINGSVRDGGADYIERNARVLMALIDTVNVMKQGNEKLVIIGPSMGGLISRYALAYMEQHSMPHQTRLWISFDSPHKGANIPIGDQRWLDFYGRKTNSEEITSKRDGKIGSTAAKQMLISHYLSPSSGGAPGFRSQFVNNMNTLGFPIGDPGQPFRKIALVDGSLGGTEINTPGQKGFTFDVRRYHNIDLWLFKIRYITYTVASARMYFTPSYGAQNAVFDGWYLNKGEEHIVSAPAGSSGLDVAPGGIFNTQYQIADGGDGKIETKWGVNGGGIRFKAKFYSVVPDHSFINTKSALAFSGSNQNLSEDISKRSLVCTGETPFDGYFGDPAQNRNHVDLWPGAINYVLKEIDGIVQLPTVQANLSISGPSQIYSNTTYTIPNLPTGSTVTWSVTPNNIVNLTPIGNDVTLSRKFFGNVTLQASIISPCGIYPTITKVVEVIIGPTAIVGKSFVCQVTPETYYIQNLSSTATVSWSIPSSTGGVLLLTPNSPSANQLSIKNQGWYSVQTILTASVTDNGTTTSYELPVAAENYAKGGNYVQDAGWVGNNNLPGGSGYASSGNVTFVNPYNEVRLNMGILQYEQISYVTGPAPRYWYYDNINQRLIFSLPTGYSSGIPFTWQVTKTGGSCPANITFFSNYINMSSFTVAPNPANSSVTVSQERMKSENGQDHSGPKSTDQNSSSNLAKKAFTVKFIDEKGKVLVTSDSVNGDAVQINTASLVDGTYFLHIEQGKDIQKKQIIVKH